MTEPTVPHALSPGGRLGFYAIEGLLGAGAMGEVFRAIDTRLDRPVAIKCLFSSRLDAPTRDRFQREAKLASSLNHPHILTVHEAGEFEGRPYLVTELVDGGTLRDWARQQPRTWRQVIDLLSGIADALAVAHEAGIIHRDIKPENILVTRNGHAKLADFGLARHAGLSQTDVTRPAVTELGQMVGTISYMAPEQISGTAVDARSDIFAFGVVLYELLGGRRPFEAPATVDVLHAIAHRTPPPLDSDLPEALRLAVGKALEKDPADRYQSMREIAVDLRRVSRPSGGEPARPARRWTTWAALAGVIVVVGVAGWMARSLGRREPSAARVQSLAVLPLRNLSRDADQAYFADGLTEALTTSLAQVGPLTIIARSSSARYQGTAKGATDIARELHVDALIEGAVERAGDRVRITAQLIDGATAHLLWAGTYERDVRDALALQSEVARTIASEIKVQLSPEQRARLTVPRTPNPEAQDAYLKGLHWSQKGDVIRRFQYFKEATEKDPDFPAAWAGLAGSYGLMILFGQLPEKEGYLLWRGAAMRALALDPNSSEAHGSLAALLQYHDWNWEDSRREFETALRLNPSSSDRTWYAENLAIRGRMDAALEEHKRAQALDPFSRTVSNTRVNLLFFSRRYGELAEYGRSLAAFDPALAELSEWAQGLALEQSGDLEGAITQFERRRARIVGQSLQGPEMVADLAYAYAIAGRRAQALQALADMEKMSTERVVRRFLFALVYAGLGEKDRAFRYLDEGYDERPSGMMFVKINPRLDSLRSDARYAALLRRMGLPE